MELKNIETSMINNWQTRKLGDISVINGGGTPPTCHTEYFSGNVPWFTPSEITSGTVSVLINSERQITEEATKHSKIAEQGTVLLSSRATIGHVGIVAIRSTYNQGIKGLTPKKELLPWYLAYWLLANKKRLEKSSFGTTFKELSTTALKRFDIAVPPISVQQQIVEKLDALKQMQELNKKKSEKANELFNSLIKSVYVSKIGQRKKINEIVNFLQYGLSRSMNSNSKGCPIFRINSIKNGEISDEGFKHVEVTDEEFKKYKVDYNDILFNRTNSYELVGKTGIFKLTGRFVFASYLIRIKTKDEIVSDYLNYFLNSPTGQAEIKKRAKRAVSQANVNAKELGTIQIFVPNKSIQEKAVNQLDSIKQYQQLLGMEKEAIGTLFEGTLYKFMNRN